MAKTEVGIVVKVKSCQQCPFFASEKVYTSDSFENVSKWECTKKKKVITGYVDWYDERNVEIPKWCPFNKKKKQAKTK